MLTPPSEMERKEILLPSEVLMEILSKLPTMSVLRFQSISKKWFNILRDEYFRNLHSDVLLHSQSPSQSYPPKILFSVARMQILGDPGHPVQNQLSIITTSSSGSTSHYAIKIFSNNDKNSLDRVSRYVLTPTIQCNGLLCIIPRYILMERPIIVTNPLTLEYIALPPCSSVPVLSSCGGLGFAPLSKQYKVVCHLVKPERVLKVYTLGDTMWRVINPHVDFNPRRSQKSGVYVDGKIYWVIWGPHPNKHRLLSFDVESEQSSVVGNLPPTAGDGGNAGFKLIQSGSRLSLIIIRGLKVEVWMLKQYCSSSSDYDCVWDMGQSLRLSADHLFTKKNTFWSLCCAYKPCLLSLKRYGCLLGERLVQPTKLVEVLKSSACI